MQKMIMSEDILVKDNSDLLVTIIIPVYMVEQYLNRCLESIINQTYEKLEIIIINDGSTDLSGNICDYYASKDSRIRVIHQSNKGLAQVRNLGIKEAHGEYILFVDSDDWVELNLVKDMVLLVSKFGADIVCFKMSRISKTEEKRKCVYSNKKIILDSSEALSCIFFSRYVDVVTCNKFIKRELFRDIKYPANRLYEDMYTTYKIIANASKVLCIDRPYYNYFNNESSIGNKMFSEKTLELDEAATQCFDFCIRQHGTDTKALSVGLWKWKIVVSNIMIRSNHLEKDYIAKVQKMIVAGDVWRCKYISVISKMQMIIFKYSIVLYKYLYKAYKTRGY